jgi:hypothetical protein
MAVVNFPNSPADGETFTYEGKTFEWSATDSIWIRQRLLDTITVPSDLTDLGITDGTVGQVLTTDGAGGFTFEDAGSDQSNFATTGKAIAMAIVFGG